MMRVLSAVTAVVLGVSLVAACGESAAKITAAAPLYVLVSRSGDLVIDVIDQTSFQSDGSIDVAPGAGQAVGAVASGPGGQVLVTFTGVQVGSQLTVKPDTRVCSLLTSQCSSVWQGWGSATALPVGANAIAVPGWNDVDFTGGRLAVFGGAGMAMQRQVRLDRSVPGPVAVSPDGRYVYWLTYAPVQANQAAAEQELLRVDGATGAVLNTVRFGQRLAFGLAVAEDGGVLVSVLYDRLPQRSNGGPPSGQVYSSTVLEFAADLSTSHGLGVGAGPTFMATAGRILMVASSASAVPNVGVYDSAGGKAIGSVEIPADWQIKGLQIVTLANGSQSGLIVLDYKKGARYRIGAVSVVDGSVTWHDFSGAAIGSVAA